MMDKYDWKIYRTLWQNLMKYFSFFGHAQKQIVLEHVNIYSLRKMASA